jgi:hypothetical protein
MALPVQDTIADLVSHSDRHQWELLQDRNLTDQLPQIPAGLDSDERGPPALLLDLAEGRKGLLGKAS